MRVVVDELEVRQSKIYISLIDLIFNIMSDEGSYDNKGEKGGMQPF